MVREPGGTRIEFAAFLLPPDNGAWFSAVIMAISAEASRWCSHDRESFDALVPSVLF